jgi:alkylation response protein AidB-like acyl-CoA dehydrogenase
MDKKVTDTDVAERLYEAARSFVPRIRELAPQMEKARRLDDKLVEDMDAAGLFSILVPKRWGGAGLGPVEVNKVVEIIASGDCSLGWVGSFYMLHNWFLCRFPLEVQQELYKNRASVRIAAVFLPPGQAEKVDGGYRVTGRWSYATGMHHASHAFVPVMVGQDVHWALIPREDLELIDDWYMQSMSATGSITIAAKNVFVRDGWTYDVPKLMAPVGHHGNIHPEEAHQYPFTALMMAPISLTIGALDAAVELTKERLKTVKRIGAPLIDRPLARIRWAHGYEALRMMRMLRDAATDEVLQQVRSKSPPTLEGQAAMQIHLVTIVHGVKEALRKLVDGNGSSGYRTGDQVLRAMGDVGVIATHALGADYDTTMDRHARWLLGLGLSPEDPVARMT